MIKKQIASDCFSARSHYAIRGQEPHACLATQVIRVLWMEKKNQNKQVIQVGPMAFFLSLVPPRHVPASIVLPEEEVGA